MAEPVGVAVVTGAAGQDGYLLTERLVQSGWTVHATMRPGQQAKVTFPAALVASGRLFVHELDLLDRDGFRRLIAELRPDEFYNLAGHSSVAASFQDPATAWRSNADAVFELLEIFRHHSRETRVYQASSGDMFGSIPGGEVVHHEESALFPQSPYAASKAAAHLLCGVYRRAYGLRVASGILFNHESRRRPPGFLSRRLVDHVRRFAALSPDERRHAPPLSMGNLAARRDWGFAPDYIEGILLVARQIQRRSWQSGRAEADEGASYRDYVLGTGLMHAVWQLTDRAFSVAGFDLEWEREGSDVRKWRAHFRASGAPAVVVDPDLLRPFDPLAIQADPARARNELGWSPRIGIDLFLKDMLEG